jgi:phosphoribosyl 1,2-cyclic phosphodiesterase
LRFELYGVRGSIASPLISSDIEKKILKVLESVSPEDLKTKESREAAVQKLPISVRGTYGGNTTCVILQSQGEYLVLDMGTGLNRFGQECLKAKRQFTEEKPLRIMLTHVHWDHIQGFPFFIPAYIPGNHIEFHSAREGFEKELLHQQESPWCPAHFDFMRAGITFNEFKITEKIKIGPFTVSAMEVHHPDNNVGYRVEADGGSFVFLSDTEITQLKPEFLDVYSEFCKGADVVYADCQYDFLGAWEKVTWGHSNAFSWIDLLSNSDVKSLVCSHFDPVTDDEMIGGFKRVAEKYVAVACADKKIPHIMAAYEGYTGVLGEDT